MKTISIILLFFCLTACTNKQKPNHFVFLFDKTDSLTAIQSLTPATVINYIFKDKLNVFWEAYTVTISEIGNGRLTPTCTFALPEEASITSDEIKRIATIDTVKSQISKEIDQIVASPKTNKTSAIFEKIQFELEELSTTTNTVSIIIFSDLIQNTKTLSFYDTNTIKKLMTSDLKWFESVFTQGRPIPNLSNISLYLIHTSSTPDEDEIFYTVATKMQLLLESHGAKVYIRSGL